MSTKSPVRAFITFVVWSRSAGCLDLTLRPVLFLRSCWVDPITAMRYMRYHHRSFTACTERSGLFDAFYEREKCKVELFESIKTLWKLDVFVDLDLWPFDLGDSAIIKSRPIDRITARHAAMVTSKTIYSWAATVSSSGGRAVGVMHFPAELYDATRRKMQLHYPARAIMIH